MARDEQAIEQEKEDLLARSPEWHLQQAAIFQARDGLTDYAARQINTHLAWATAKLLAQQQTQGWQPQC